MRARRPSLRRFVFLGGALIMLLPALVAASFYTGSLQQRAEDLLVDKLTTRGELSANLIARRLHELWTDVARLAANVDPSELGRVRDRIDFTGSLDSRYSWLGLADVNGKVLAAKGGMLEGVSVEGRPWFRRGLAGPAAIDVHEAVLLAKVLPASPEPYRFIDLAAPIKSADGTVVGVVGAHFDWRWIVDNLKALQAPGIDVLLVSRDRIVLHGPADLVDKPLTVGSALAANRAQTAVIDERWPDGKSYATVVIPAVGHADLPSFGWSLLIRQEMDAALGPTRQLVRSFWATLGAGALVALGFLWLGATWVSMPLSRIVAVAEGMVDGAGATAPRAEDSFVEVERLSSALIRVQSKLLRGVLDRGADTERQADVTNGRRKRTAA
jgi:hypothetical protein